MTTPNRSLARSTLLFCLLTFLLAGCTMPRPASDRAGPPPDTAVGAPAVPAENSPEPTAKAADSPDWRKPGATADERLADTDACYSLALARINNDISIDRDINAARGQVNSTLFPDQAVERRVDGYYYKKERLAWFEDCMRTTGYIRD